MSNDFRNLFIASAFGIGDVATPADPDSPQILPLYLKQDPLIANRDQL